MKNTKYNNKQIEDWATIKVKHCLSMTDTLSQYIKENDKTPSWDGDVLIYKGNNTDKRISLVKLRFRLKEKWLIILIEMNALSLLIWLTWLIIKTMEVLFILL